MPQAFRYDAIYGAYKKVHLQLYNFDIRFVQEIKIYSWKKKKKQEQKFIKWMKTNTNIFF